MFADQVDALQLLPVALFVGVLPDLLILREGLPFLKRLGDPGPETLMPETYCPQTVTVYNRGWGRFFRACKAA